MIDRALKPPSLFRWANELVAIPKLLASPLRKPVERPPFGGGRPALVLPGMLSGDRSTAFLRRSLEQAGFVAFGWGERFNKSADVIVMGRLEKRLSRITRETGRRAIVVGWSLGGVYARILALRQPQAISLVVTLGSPFSGDRHANNAWRLYEVLNNHRVDDPPFPEDPSVKPHTRTIAVWSPKDGIVAPESARGTTGEADEAIELPYRHFEFGSSRKAVTSLLDILADQLA